MGIEERQVYKYEVAFCPPFGVDEIPMSLRKTRGSSNEQLEGVMLRAGEDASSFEVT